MTAVVSGATLTAMPSVITTSPGRMAVQQLMFGPESSANNAKPTATSRGPMVTVVRMPVRSQGCQRENRQSDHEEALAP